MCSVQMNESIKYPNEFIEKETGHVCGNDQLRLKYELHHSRC